MRRIRNFARIAAAAALITGSSAAVAQTVDGDRVGDRSTDRGFDMGWVGLIGLLGLAGLRNPSRKLVHPSDRTAAATR